VFFAGLRATPGGSSFEDSEKNKREDNPKEGCEQNKKNNNY
jgi:hypothetical protein